MLCNPIGYEAMCAHAAYRFLAEQLAAAGYPALRFDYDGTGDSFGSDEDDGRVESWLASIGHAIDTLRSESGASHIALFGVRLGATLASFAATDRGDVSSLLLWAPCRTGKSYLRELRALRAAHSQRDSIVPYESDQELEEAAGFIYTRETADALTQMGAADISNRPAERALLLGRDDLPNDPRLSKSLTALGTTVTQAEWPGYAAMMRDAQDTEIPQAAIASIIDWLGGQTKVASGSRAPALRISAQERPLLASEDFTEEAVFIETCPQSFGILTRPLKSERRSDTAVLLLNAGANHHIGPNRMYVTLARHLAKMGFPSLRLDIPGIGDSAKGAGSAREQIYSSSAVQVVQAAMTHLETRICAKRFILLGLCSGAYMAFQTAARDPRVSTQILINPQTFEWKEGDTLESRMRQSYKSTGIYLTSLSKTSTLKRMIFGQVDIKGISSVLCRRLIARSAMTAKSLTTFALKRKPFESHVRQTFRKIAERGTDTLFLFAADDVGLELTTLHFGTHARGISRQKNIDLATFEGADHTFTRKIPREQMLSHIVQHLTERYPECGCVADGD